MEEIKKEEVVVENKPQEVKQEFDFNALNTKIDNLLKENDILKKEVLELKNQKVEIKEDKVDDKVIFHEEIWKEVF